MKRTKKDEPKPTPVETEAVAEALANPEALPKLMADYWPCGVCGTIGVRGSVCAVDGWEVK